MRLFAGGATTPLVVKIWTKQPWMKIENLLFALPISPEIMDIFWCSRCLNNCIEVPDMMRLFAGGATTPLVVKIWTKQPWVKIENLHNFDRNFALFRGKIWLWLFYNFIYLMVLKFYTKIWSHFEQKFKAWHWFSQFKMKSKFGKIAVMPLFLVEMTWDFFVEFWNHNTKKII